MNPKTIEIEYNAKYEIQLTLDFKTFLTELNNLLNIVEYKVYDNEKNEITNENDYQNFIKNNNKPKVIIKSHVAESNYLQVISYVEVQKKQPEKVSFSIGDSKTDIENENNENNEYNKFNERIKMLENQIKQLNEKIENLTDENNELKQKIFNEKKIENINNNIKSYIESEMEKFKQNLINEILEYNNKILNNEIKTETQLIHYKYKCEHCNIKPIIGIRYKCNECINYNLCEKCYNDLINNKINHEHKNFIKKDYIPSIKQFSKNNIMYSYSTNGYQRINKKVNPGNNNYTMHITIKNNGDYTYPDNTKLVCDPKSNIKCDSINIKPLKPGESEIVYLFFENLDKYERGKRYIIYLNFEVENEIFGDHIEIRLNLLLDDNEYIRKMREEFKLGEEYSDETLKKYLRLKDYDIYKAFECMINVERKK